MVKQFSIKGQVNTDGTIKDTEYKNHYVFAVEEATEDF